MTSYVFAALLVAFALCVYASIRLVCKAWALLFVSAATGRTKDVISVDDFLLLLQEAKCKMLLCIDSNRVQESVYYQDSVLDAVRLKLAADRGFRIKCLVAGTYEVPFVTRFRNHDQVSIRYIDPRELNNTIHRIVIDDGRKAYVSWDVRDGTERKMIRFDLTGVPRRHLKYALISMLGESATDADMEPAPEPILGWRLFWSQAVPVASIVIVAGLGYVIGELTSDRPAVEDTYVGTGDVVPDFIVLDPPSPSAAGSDSGDLDVQERPDIEMVLRRFQEELHSREVSKVAMERTERSGSDEAAWTFVTDLPERVDELEEQRDTKVT